MKKYGNENKITEYWILVVIAFVCMGLCFIMMLNMLSNEPLLQPVNKIDYEYSQITVSSETESETESDVKMNSQSDSSAGTLTVNLNTATKEELMKLEGIGEKRANDIIAYRENYGPFKKTSQIMNVEGIGEKIFEKIMNNLTV